MKSVRTAGLIPKDCINPPKRQDEVEEHRIRCFPVDQQYRTKSY